MVSRVVMAMAVTALSQTELEQSLEQIAMTSYGDGLNQSAISIEV